MATWPVGVSHRLRSVLTESIEGHKWINVISAGTEGVNSILKFLKYAKEDKKNDAVQTLAPASGGAGVAALHATQKDALAAMNRK